MAWYVISYDLRKVRDYTKLYEVLNGWKAVRLFESFWLAELTGPAATVRDSLKQTIDNDDGVAVIQLQSGFQWATWKALPDGTAWLKQRSP